MIPKLPHAHGLLALGYAFLILLGAIPQDASAQVAGATTRSLSLAEAVEMARQSSEALTIARSQLDVAASHRTIATSARLPRVAGYSSFDRALRSEFQGLDFGAPAEPSAPTSPPVDLPFGSPNTYRVGVTVEQTVFSGGATRARGRAAASESRAAELGLRSAQAALTLEVTAAYYDAVLTAQLARIAASSLAQADSTVERASVLLRAGRGSEFDWLRARVARDRQRPTVIRHATDRDVAMLRLRQLVHAPSDETLALTTGLELEPPAARLASLEIAPAPSELAPRGAARSVVQAAGETVRRHEALLSASRAARWPSISLTSSYERVAYPRTGLPGGRDFRTNWTAGARLDLPLFTGGRQRGTEREAEAELIAAHASLQRTAQLAALDSHIAAAQLAAAEAAWAASDGGVREATRAYEITALRHREGLAIQLELADARLALEDARAERARAARDVLVERLRTALLADLPLRTDGAPR
jgi:multidrug efflux system outer membrane protein